MIIPITIPIRSCRDARSLRPLIIKKLSIGISDTRAVCPYFLGELFNWSIYEDNH